MSLSFRRIPELLTYCLLLLFTSVRSSESAHIPVHCLSFCQSIIPLVINLTNPENKYHKAMRFPSRDIENYLELSGMVGIEVKKESTKEKPSYFGEKVKIKFSFQSSKIWFSKFNLVFKIQV